MLDGSQDAPTAPISTNAKARSFDLETVTPTASQAITAVTMGSMTLIRCVDAAEVSAILYS